MFNEINHFASLEQARKSLRAQIQAVDPNVRPRQRAIRTDDCFGHDSGCGFPVCGNVIEDKEERPSYLRNFRFCRCYSVACPEGELGDVHVTLIETPLSRKQPDEARARGWQQ